ncbi:MAG: hypothetical protein K1060chlam5_01362 [Candidatus Anoxychlamydiales bacterium]|nr:hypothetical protein [Candidatus Anoxychlamydiales bacterium]
MELIENIKKIYKYLIISVISISFSLFYIYSKKMLFDFSEHKNIEFSIKQENKQFNFFGKKIFLEKEFFDFSINEDLITELIVSKSSQRPDSKIDKICFEFYCSSFSTPITVFENEKIYIKKEDNIFTRSLTPTNYWFVFNQNTNSRIKIDLFAEIENSEKKIINTTFYKNDSDFLIKDRKKTISVEFEEFNKAYWLDKDLFMQTLDFKVNREKERLVIGNSTIYIDSKDLLIFKNGSWKIANENENTTKYPIANIRKVENNSIYLEGFSINGIEKYNFVIPKKNDFFDSNKKNEELITSIKRRTRLHINIIINNQRFIIKEGDILIKEGDKFLVKRNNFDLH